MASEVQMVSLQRNP